MRNIVIFISVVFLFLSCQPGDNDYEDNNEETIITNTVIPLFNDNYPYMLDSLFNSARKTIDIMMFEMYFYDNGSVRELEDDLCSAALRGVKVNVLLDGSFDENATRNQETADYLMSNGVNVKFDPAGVTTHSKIVMIDSCIVVVGSTNWSYSAFESNNEANAVIIDTSICRQFLDYFYSIW